MWIKQKEAHIKGNLPSRTKKAKLTYTVVFDSVSLVP
jgi:hypothetical protein